jgi:ATP-binding cassette subfamily B protein
MTVEQPQFWRMIPQQHWFRGRGILLALWSVLAALCLVGVVAAGYATLDLLVYQGRIEVVDTDLDQLKPYVTEVGPDGVGEDLGLRSLLWRNRTCPCARLVRTPLSRLIPFRSNRSTLATLLILGVSLWLLRVWCLRRAARCAQGIAQTAGNTLRSQIHRQILRLGPGDLDQRDANTAQYLFLGASDAITGSMAKLLSTGLYDVAALLMVFGLLAGLDWAITLQTLVPFIIAYLLMQWVAEREAGKSRQFESQGIAGLQALAEGLRKSRIVRGYGMEAIEQERFHKHLDQHSQTLLAAIPGDWGSWLARLGGGLLLAVVGFLAGSRVLGTGQPLDLPKALTVLGGLALLIPVVRSLSCWKAWRETIEVEGAEINRFLSILPEVGQAVGAKFIDPVSKSIQFEAVHYVRDQRPLLKGLELRIPAGSVMAFVSTDPQEARAVASLIPRFLEPQRGRVLFDGEDIAWGTLESIRAEAIYVGGNDPCFTGTVSENIRGGDAKYDSQQVMEAAKLVHAHQFIQKLPQGYETVLEEQGHRLSAGQTFLLGLARAIIRNPAVLIIDEPTAALDQATKDSLDDSYQRIQGQRTVIFIPSRLSTVRRCDKVVVIDNGQVEAIGHQSDLVKSCELYRHWEYVTFNAFRRGGEKG